MLYNMENMASIYIQNKMWKYDLNMTLRNYDLITFNPSSNVKKIFFISFAQVTRMQPAFVIQGFLGFILQVEIPHEDVPTPKAHLPNTISINIH